MNEKAWLIYQWVDDPTDHMIALDENDALETYMALVEEEMYETFCWICQDRYELADQDWEQRAQWLSPYDSCWYVMEVPIIYGDPCGEELPKPACG